MSLDAPSLIANRMRTMRPSLVRELLKRATSPNIISFAGGLPNPKFFPNLALIDASADVLKNDGGSVLQYAISEGYPGLRQWIADRYRARFDLDVPVDAMMITTGSQQGIDLIGKVFIDAGDAVAIERPGYQGMLHALSVYQPKWVGVNLNEDGLDLAHLDKQLTESKAKLLMVCPNYQNPSGITYTEANRAAVAEIVKRHNVMLVEDDPYSELGFGGKSPTSFRRYLPEQCIALGSFSKLVSPGMRLGWLIAPSSVYERFVIAKQGTDFHTSNFAQRVLHSYLAATNIDDHVALIQKGYAAQCAAMLKAIDTYFPAETHVTRPDGGMFIWMTLPEGADTVKLLNEAIDAGVTFLPGQTFYTDGGGKNQLRLSYSQSDEERIDEGIKRLAAVVLRHLDAAA
jgi:2-aminoadipate transaminase